MAEAKLLENRWYEEIPLENILLQKGLISIENLNEAKALQRRYRDRLDEVLLKEGFIKSEDLYDSLAEHFNLKYIDIKKNPCDKDLLLEEDFFKYAKYKFIPWRKVGKIVFIAVVSMNDELFLYLKKQYRDGFRIIFTTPQNITTNIQRRYSETNLSIIKKELRVIDPKYSSYKLLSTKSKIVLVFVLGIIIFALIQFSTPALRLILIGSNIIFFSNIIFKMFLFFYGRKDKVENDSYKKIAEDSLPTYSILLPLYKEGLVVKNLLQSMRNLNYPKSKLDIILIVEQFDRQTIKFLNKENYDGLFKIICVPKSQPQTKPKACSYALKFAEGEYITIYDAEDRPETDQLLKAVDMFRKEGKKVACLQSKLHCFNFKESLIAFLFSVEYLIWFGVFLRGLENLNIPIPLGGNSNHFRTDVLKYMGGWDPYNVTEDADLGYRLAKKGYSTKMLNSITWEEAPINLKGWIKQRSRWIKGHMQTYIVHLRDSNKLKDDFGLFGVLGFHCFLALPVIAYFLQILVLSSIFLETQDTWVLFLKDFSIFNMILWVALSVFLGFFAVIKNKWKNVRFLYVVFYPFYYCLHFISAIIALYQLIFKTHYWEKTAHEFDNREQQNKAVKR